MIIKIYIENELIDMFADENIELNSSVVAIEDVSKVSTDYTKTFTVPASDNNNRIFKHYYNADIDNTFDARTKKNCRIEVDGLPFRTGKMRLEKVAVKNGAPSSYTINFWGELVNFKTLLGDDLLTGLDLSAYDHNYGYDNVRAGLTTGLFDKDIIYTLISNKRQYYYNSDPDDNTDTDKLVNIAYNGEDRGINWTEVKPSVRLLAIIEAIEAKYGITFSRDFFGRNEFKELYMWLNNEEGALTEQLINWTSGNADDFGLNFATDTWTLNDYEPYESIKYRLDITPSAGYETVPYKIIAKQNGQVVFTEDAIGHRTTANIDPGETPFSLQFFISAGSTFEYQADLRLRAQVFIAEIDKNAASPISTIVDLFNISKAIPALKVIDFMRALFRMFKLVAIPDSLGNVYVNNIDDYYREGKVYDVTKWVDSESYEVNRGNLFNTLRYKFQDPTTLLNMQFKKDTGTAYGDEVLYLKDDEGVPLDGEELEIETPFELIVFERLSNIQVNEKTPIQYGLAVDDKLEPANPTAVIYYNNSVSLSLWPISLLNAAGETTSLAGIVNTPAHTLGFDAPQFSVLWGPEFSTWNSALIENTLFKNYWQSYISSIFNIKRRNFRFSAKLPVWMLTKLQLNDVLFIKDRYYRISDFTLNLLTGRAVLNLMNSFENNFGLFVPSQYRVMLTAPAQSYGVYVTNGATMNIVKEDLGAGTDWATVTQSGYNINIAVTENTGAPRAIYINVDNGAGKSFQIFLNQEAP